jgi:hypothetical protein
MLRTIKEFIKNTLSTNKLIKKFLIKNINLKSFNIIKLGLKNFLKFLLRIKKNNVFKLSEMIKINDKYTKISFLV